ncbi:MAG: hypothetical protein EOP41_03805 [Sphingobacteriaceae bacterium]|nr:MAG: hypothetical protein EOP41_03805 [Sphingobacteriaceae bacterium]
MSWVINFKVATMRVRDCSGKPAAQRGLAAESPTGWGRARPNSVLEKERWGRKKRADEKFI